MLETLSNKRLFYIWLKFKKKRNMNNEFGHNDIDYLTMNDREKLIDILFERLINAAR